jgi:hypothetical protein
MSSEFISKSQLAYHMWSSPLGVLGLVARDDKLAGISLDADPLSFPFEVERTYGSPGRRDDGPFAETVRRGPGTHCGTSPTGAGSVTRSWRRSSASRRRYGRWEERWEPIPSPSCSPATA